MKLNRVLALIMVLVFTVSICGAAFANVIRDENGKVIAAVSNKGSETAQERRSERGTAMKTEHDGIVYPGPIW